MGLLTNYIQGIIRGEWCIYQSGLTSAGPSNGLFALQRLEPVVPFG